MKKLPAFILVCMPALAWCQQTPDFTGTWSGVMTSQDNEYWDVEDFVCFSGCPRASYDYMSSMLDDPENDDVPTSVLNGRAYRHMHQHFTEIATEEGLKRQTTNTEATNPSFYCEPYDYVKQVTNTLPMQIREENGHLVFQYEEWNISRTVYMDGREAQADLEHTAMGYSVGRYEGDTLVVQTTHVAPGLFYGYQTGGSHTDQLTGIERYTVRQKPRRLHLELTLTDAVILKEPLNVTKTWVSTPEVELLTDSCEDIPGQP